MKQFIRNTVASGSFRLFLVALFAHGLIPFCTAIVSDDWFTLLAYREASLAAAWKGAVFLSMPLTVLQSLPFFIIGDNIFILRLINFIIIWLLSVSFHDVLRILRPNLARENLWIAALATALPGYMVHFMISFLFYPLGVLLFLVALSLALRAEKTESLIRRRVLLTLSAVLTFYSFHFGALLVAYMLFVSAHFWVRWRGQEISFFQAILDYTSSRYVFLLLPFWFWGLRQVFGIVMPAWAQYNQPSLDVEMIKRGVIVFGQYYGATLFRLIISPWYLAAFVGCLALSLARVKSLPSPVVLVPRWTRPLAMVIGFGVLALGVMPFILVGKYPVTDFDPRVQTAFALADLQILRVIDTRMHLFFGFAGGLALVSLILEIRDRLRLPDRLGQALLFAILFSSFVTTNRYYLHIQRQGILMEGVRENLRQDDRLKNTRIIGVVDRVGNISTTWDSWVLFLRTCWGDLAHHGVPEHWYGQDLNASLVFDPAHVINKRLYGGAWHEYFTSPSPDSPQATVILSPGESYYRLSDFEAVCGYYYERIWAGRRARAFARKFVRIDVIQKVDLFRYMSAKPEALAGWKSILPGDADADGLATASHLVRNTERKSDEPLRFRTQRPADGGGRHVVVEIEGDLSDSSVGLVGAQSEQIPLCHYQVAGKTILIGILKNDDELVRFTVDAVASGLRPGWSLVRAVQSPRLAEDTFSLMAEPYFSPVELYPEYYRSFMDLQEQYYASILWHMGARPEREDIIRMGDNTLYTPSNNTAYLSTDLVPVDHTRTVLVRIEWSAGVSEKEAARLEVEDEWGHRLIDLLPPAEGGRLDRVYTVPVRPESGRVCIAIRSPTGRGILPRRMTLMQVGDVLNQKRPLEELFFPRSHRD